MAVISKLETCTINLMFFKDFSPLLLFFDIIARARKKGNRNKKKKRIFFHDANVNENKETRNLKYLFFSSILKKRNKRY